MIASSTFEVIPAPGTFPRLPSLYLGPFDEQELDEQPPVTAENIQFFPIGDIEFYTTSDSATIVAALEMLPHTTFWGIFKEEALTPSSFVGTVSLSDRVVSTHGLQIPSTPVYEFGTWIMSPAERQKGLGSLARLATMAYAYEIDAAHAFAAWTSAKNVGAQRSLAKVGFRCMGVSPHVGFPDDADGQEWMLAAPDVQVALRGRILEEQVQLLHEGWEENGRLREGLRVQKQHAA